MKLMALFLMLFCLKADASEVRTIPASIYKAPVSLSGSSNLSIGAELGAISPINNEAISQASALGILGSYKLDPNWAIQGDMFFSSHTANYRFCTWYGVYEQTLSVNTVSLSAGPVYRATSKRFSPVLGAFVTYGHEYDNIAQGYGTQPVYYASDSLFVGPMAGLDYRINKDISVGVDLRYMVNLATTTSLPSAYQSQGSLNYYVAGINVKFAF